MKDFFSYLDSEGNYHEFNVNGLAVQLSQLDIVERELYVYNQFYARAQSVAKYYYKKHQMDLNECICYIASGLYSKFLELRERDIKKHDNVHYNSVEYLVMLRTFNQLKHALLRSNHVATTAYTDNYYAPRVETSFSNGKSIVIPAHTVKGKLEDKPVITSTKMFDIVDVIEIWENRYSRKMNRLYEAMDALNAEQSDNDVTLSLNYDNMNDEDKKIIRSKMYQIARDKNDLRHLTELNGNYLEPLQALEKKCLIARARAHLASDKQFNHVRNIVLSDSDITVKDRKVLQRFRDRNNLFYNGVPLSRDELIYLFK